MKQMHKQVFIVEKEQKLCHWRCFKKMDDLYGRITRHVRCLMCDSAFKFDSYILMKHALVDHTLEERNLYDIYQWPMKYCKYYDDYSVQCNFCPQIILLILSWKLKYHIKTEHSIYFNNRIT